MPQRSLTGSDLDPTTPHQLEVVASQLSAAGHRVEPLEMPQSVSELGRRVIPIISAHVTSTVTEHSPGRPGNLERSNRELVEFGSAMSAVGLIRARHELDLARG